MFGTIFFAADGDRSVRVDVQSVVRSKVMRVVVDSIRTLSYDTYRGVCRLSYFPYDVEPYVVSTAMAERRKQQGKRDRCVWLQPIDMSLYGQRSISLRPSATSRRSFPWRRAMCPINSPTIRNGRGFLQ